MIVEKELNLRNEYEVFEQIKELFGTEKWAKDHQDNKISRMNVMWIDTKDITRPPVNSVKITRILHREYRLGVRLLFSYAVQYYNRVNGRKDKGALGVTGINSQRFSCGCPPCANFEFLRPSDENQCVACHFPQRRDVIPLRREDNIGVAAQKIAARQKVDQELDNLKDGDFVAFETGDYRIAQKDGGGSKHGFNVGRIISKFSDTAYIVAEKTCRKATMLQQDCSKGHRLIKLRLYKRNETDPLTFEYNADRDAYWLNATKSFLGPVDLEELANPYAKPKGSTENLTLSQLEDFAMWQNWKPKFKMTVELESSLENKVSH